MWELGLKLWVSVWYTYSNIFFQFLNNITRIFTHFFIHIYIKKIQIIFLKLLYQIALNFLGPNQPHSPNCRELKKKTKKQKNKPVLICKLYGSLYVPGWGNLIPHSHSIMMALKGKCAPPNQLMTSYRWRGPQKMLSSFFLSFFLLFLFFYFY